MSMHKTLKLTLNADVPAECIAAAYDELRLAFVDERPLSKLETLGRLLLSQNAAVVMTMRPDPGAPASAHSRKVSA